MDACVLDRLGVASAAGDRLKQRRGKSGARREIRHALQTCRGRHGHDSSHNRQFDPSKFAPRAPIMERVVVEEQLGNDVVRARVGLGLEVIELHDRVGRLGVSFREAGHADSESAPIVHPKPLALALDEANEIGRVTEVSECQDARPTWRIAAQRQDIAHAVGGVELEDRVDLVTSVAEAGQVRNRLEVGFAAQPHNQRMGVVSGGTARTVGDRHKTGLERRKISDGTIERLPARVGLWWKELEAQGRRVARQDVRDVHCPKGSEALHACPRSCLSPIMSVPDHACPVLWAPCLIGSPFPSLPLVG